MAKKITSKTTRTMEVTTVSTVTGERRILAVTGRNVEEATGRAISIFGLDSVERVYDPFTGQDWLNFRTVQLLKEVATLKARVAELEKEKVAAGRRTIKYDRRNYVAVPLTVDESITIAHIIEDSAGRGFGNGKMLTGSYETHGTYEDVIDYPGLLPQFSCYLVRCEYSREQGTSGHRIWGMVEVS